KNQVQGGNIMVTADLVIHNAVVLTLDANNRRAGSVAVRDGKIVGIWTESRTPDDEVKITFETNVIDANGATLIPGFVDTHNHIYVSSQLINFVNCMTTPNKTIQNMLSNLKKKAEKTPAGEWIKVYGYDDTSIEELRHLTREEIVRVVPDHPVNVSHISGHLSVVNT